jgi:hypothetical protein
MSSKRIRLTQGQYASLTESRDWCAKNGLSGLRDFYDQELEFQAGRGALPPGAREYQRLEDERPRRR